VITFVGADIWLGEFNLPIGAPAWNRTNTVDERAPLIAFPRTTVRIEQEGREAVVSDPTRAVVYRSGQPYRREAISADGDRCSFVTFSAAIVAEAIALYQPAAVGPRRSFPFVSAAIRRSDYLELERLRKSLASGGYEAEAVRESLYWLVARVLARGYLDGKSVRRDRRSATHRAHAEAVDSVRANIGRELDVAQSLDVLARAACMSPFHMSRVFREHTGRSIHAYRTELRLRASLDPIASGGRLADVALAVGFASQAHLTDRFTRAYGVSPHAWRRSLNSRRARTETRRIMEASGRGRSVA
jgi:AraC-like DNA-binding protein